jgi:Chaperone of endosialidase
LSGFQEAILDQFPQDGPATPASTVEITVMSGALVRSTRLARPVSKKKRFQHVDREEVLRKIRSLSLTSWNYIGHDPEKFRHYGPMAQEFFAAFGNDGVGTVGSPTTINSGDIAGI